MTAPSMIFVVDDDDGVRHSIRALLESSGYVVEDYGSPQPFLENLGSRSEGCVIADMRMPHMSGLELHQELLDRGSQLPVIIITGYGDVALAVRAMKSGAADFIPKPVDPDELLASVKRALDRTHKTRGREAEARTAKQMLELLTPREREVFEQLVIGRSNKVAAHQLGISPRTIETHRARIMEKMGARSLSEIVRLALAVTPPLI
jgi:two-component system response regulator FixJ